MVSPADGPTRIQRQPTLPAVGATDSARPGAEPATPATAPASVPADGLQTAPETVSVKAGDSLFLIAAHHQVSMEQMRKLNPSLFGTGPDTSGLARSVDGSLIYPGDTVRLRPAHAPAPAPQQASQKVVSAAKAFIQAANPGDHASPDQLLESARRMMDLIPASDPDHDRLKARIETLSRSSGQVEAGGGAAPAGAPLVQPPVGGTPNPVGPLPGAQPIPAAAPSGPVQVAQQPQAAPGYPQGQAPQPPVAAPVSGQAGWPANVPTGATPYPDVPQAVVGQMAPMRTYTPAVPPNGSIPVTPAAVSDIPAPGTVLPPPSAPPSSGMIFVAGARIVEPYGHWESTNPQGGNAPTGQQNGQGNGVAATQTGTQPANGKPGEPAEPSDPSNPRGKDPNDPKVQALERFLATAKDSDIVKLVQEDSMKLLTATPAQKARMLQILLAGRTTGAEQDAILSILQSAQDQGESAASLDALDRLEGGAGKGALRLNEDLERKRRQQMLSTLTSTVPFNEKYPPAFYQNLAARMEKADIEALGSGEWLSTLPDQVKAAFVQKLQAPWWWPFGGNRQLAQQIQSTMGR